MKGRAPPGERRGVARPMASVRAREDARPRQRSVTGGLQWRRVNHETQAGNGRYETNAERANRSDARFALARADAASCAAIVWGEGNCMFGTGIYAADASAGSDSVDLAASAA